MHSPCRQSCLVCETKCANIQQTIWIKHWCYNDNSKKLDFVAESHSRKLPKHSNLDWEAAFPQCSLSDPRVKFCRSNFKKFQHFGARRSRGRRRRNLWRIIWEKNLIFGLWRASTRKGVVRVALGTPRAIKNFDRSRLKSHEKAPKARQEKSPPEEAQMWGFKCIYFRPDPPCTVAMVSSIPTKTGYCSPASTVVWSAVYI